ncbi:hypothetical protein BD413DRAFT_490977 [Trametes elegans]|nr:hypothetical protein BD413DRAFT_490977 [Trametes elegans]
MKSALALLPLLAAATAGPAGALTTPRIRVRQGAANNTTPVCPSASLVSASTLALPIGSGGIGGALELATFACAPRPPAVAAAATGLVQADGLLDGLLGGLLDGLLWWFFPHPHPPSRPPRTTTVTRISTATRTDTATQIETETETVTATTTVLSAPASPSASAVDVCGAICTTVCAQPAQNALPPVSEDCAQLVNAITILNGQIPPTFIVAPQHAQTITFGTCRFFFENAAAPGPLEYCWLSLYVRPHPRWVCEAVAEAQVASAAGTACFPPVQPITAEALCAPADGAWEVGAAHS